MKSSTFTFIDRDGIAIFVYKWEPEIKPKAVVQIVHGLSEHAKRYTRVAEALCNEGYICYANDQRGHGLTAGDLTETHIIQFLTRCYWSYLFNFFFNNIFYFFICYIISIGTT